MTKNRQPLTPAVSAERREIEGRRSGRLSFYAAGEGAPMLLVHSINAAGSVYEVRPIFERAMTRHRVYAVDLPGFGFSDRSDRPYTMRLYVDAIHDMVEAILAETGAASVHALALSLSGEFLARAATERPERFRTLALVTPTGFERGSSKRRATSQKTREVPGLYKALNVPLWGRGLFDLLASRPSIRFFLQKTWGSKRIDEGLFEYDVLTTHQPGARHAPYAFVSGRLFSLDIRDVYERLALPVWMPHGTRGDFGDFSEADWARARTNWTVQPFISGALPHFEHPDQFVADYEAFLARAERSRESGGDSGAREPEGRQPAA